MLPSYDMLIVGMPLKTRTLVLLTVACGVALYATVFAFGGMTESSDVNAAMAAAVVVILITAALQFHMANRTRFVQAGAVNLGVWFLFAILFIVDGLVRHERSTPKQIGLLGGLAIGAASLSLVLYKVVSQLGSLLDRRREDPHE